jgi:hypothetical protein
LGIYSSHFETYIKGLWKLYKIFEVMNVLKTNVLNLSPTIFPALIQQMTEHFVSMNDIHNLLNVYIHFPRYSTFSTSLIDSVTREASPWMWKLGPSTDDNSVFPHLFFTKFDPLFNSRGKFQEV